MKVGKFAVNFLAKQLVRGNAIRRKQFPSLNDFDGMIDVPYIVDGIKHHQFDIFYAAKENRKNICIIDIHGGAYVFGEHRDNYIFGYEFLKKGFDFVAIDYIPNNGKRNVKSSIDDCVRCINHIFKHLEELKLENDKFIIAGDSAGGHFALLIAEAIDNKEVAEILNYEFLDNVKFELALLNCPVYDFANVGKDMLKPSGKKRMFGPNYKDESSLNLISPRTYIGNFKKPFFVSTCTKDFLRNESLLLKEDGEKYQLNMTFVDIKSNAKGVEHVHNVVRPSLKDSIKVNNAMEDFVLKHI